MLYISDNLVGELCGIRGIWFRTSGDVVMVGEIVVVAIQCCGIQGFSLLSIWFPIVVVGWQLVFTIGWWLMSDDGDTEHCT